MAAALPSKLFLAGGVGRTAARKAVVSLSKQTAAPRRTLYQRQTFPVTRSAEIAELPNVLWGSWNSDRYFSWIATSTLLVLPLVIWADSKRVTTENKANWFKHMAEEDEALYYRKMDNMGKPLLL